MRKNLLLIVLAFSLVLLFSKLGFAQTNEYSLVPVDLIIHPCAPCPMPIIQGDADLKNLVEIDINIKTIEDLVAWVCPLAVTGTAGAVLDTILTGGLLSDPPPAYLGSLVAAAGTKIVNPYGIGGPGGPYTDPMLFPVVLAPSKLLPSEGLYAKMFFRVDCEGTIIFNTMVHSTGGYVTMNRVDGSDAVINWGPAQTVGTFNVVRAPEVPPVPNCHGPYEFFVNDVVPISITATDGGGTPLAGIIEPVLTCGSGVLSGSIGNWTYNWNTTGCLEGEYDLTFGVFDGCDTVSCEAHVKLIATVGFIRIGNTLNANPCDLVEVPVLLKPSVDFGGFQLMIEFDPTLLYFQGVERGKDLDETTNGIYDWELFTYRQLPCPMCGCCKYKLEIFGLYDLKDKHQGLPISMNANYLEIAKLKFKVACDQNIRGYDLNICFEFDDETCSENTFSNVSGNLLYVSDNEEFYPTNICPMNAGVLNKLHFDLFAPPGTLNPDGRPCGGVLVKTTTSFARGDINLNGMPYDPADAVLFSSYFIYGTGVFTIDKQTQINKTDINADGFPLSLSDFILMLRIIMHDATAIPKPTPGSDLATIYVTQGTVTTNATLGAALLTFKGEGKVSSNLTFEQGVVDGNLRVLVYMNSGAGITGELLTVSGATLEKIEAVDNFGRPVKVTLVNKVIPTAFALHPNYPNPFNPTTNISFALPIDSKVSLKLYNIAGQLVRTLVNETMPAGTHTVTWDGNNSNGEKVASGIYFYKLNAGDFSKTMKMVMTK